MKEAEADEDVITKRVEERETRDKTGYEAFVQVLWPDHCVQGSAGAQLVVTG